MRRDGTDTVTVSSPEPDAGDQPRRCRDRPRYESDPVRFASRILGVELWSKQKEVLAALRRQPRVAVKSGNGLGKDFTAAVAVLWYLQRHNSAIVLSTAPTFRQVRHVLWRQIRSLYRPASDILGGRMLDTRWELADDRYALGLSATDAEQFQGFHSPNLLVVIDEAEGVDEEIYEAVESVMTSADAKLLLIGNPTTGSGGFHRAFHRERGIYTTITISALESPNVVAGQNSIPGLTTAQWVEERRAMWGEQSPLYRARILGEFPDRADDSLLAVPDLEAAVFGVGANNHSPLPADAAGPLTTPSHPLPAANHPLTTPNQPLTTPNHPLPADDWALTTAAGPLVLGVDPARFGPDRSVVLVRRGSRVEDIRVYPSINTTGLAGVVANLYHELHPDRINIDEVGVGVGVVDNLREQGIPVHGVNGSLPPQRDRACGNLRAEGYWTLARRFEKRNIRIPHDAELMAELASLRYRFNSRGKVLMESKQDMKRRGLPSPDKADALMLAFLGDDPFSGDQRWMRDLFI